MTRAGLLQRLRQQISGPKTVELPISCYGKLPIYKDFLRENLASKHAQAFKHWLDKGIGHYWGANDVFRGETIYPHAFLLRFPGTARYVVGYLWGSHDEGELRFFPFSVFASLPAGREAFPPHAVLEILEPMIAAGRRWHNESTQLTSFEDFVKWSRGLSLEVTLKPEQEVISEILSGADALTMDDFTTGLWMEGSDLEWPALLSYMGRYHDRVKSHRHPTELAVRFPSSGRLPLVLQAQYWTLIIERFDNRRERPFQMLMPVYEEKAGITVILRNLRPDDVFAFHPQMPLNEHIEDFRGSVPRRAGHDVDPMTLADKQLTLNAFLASTRGAARSSATKGI